MVTIPQTELGFRCGGWSALRRTIFVAFGDQLHHSFWISKQRHPLFTVCTGVPCLGDHRGAMACINVPRTVSKKWWTFNDLPSYADSSWHLWRKESPYHPKLSRKSTGLLAHPLSIFSLSLFLSRHDIQWQSADYSMSRFCTKSSSHSNNSFLDILVLITHYLLSFLGHPTKSGRRFQKVR